MNRRDYLKYSLSLAALVATGWRGSQAAVPGAGAMPSGRTVLDIMLLGGADLRFLFVPAPGSAYAEKFWSARRDLYADTPANARRYASYEAVWQDLYLPTTYGGQLFGIHRNAAWLKGEFDAGRVAIVCNVLAAESRQHDQAQQVELTGDPSARADIVDRDGWGGRLAQAIGAAKVVVVTDEVSVWGKSTNTADRLSHLVQARDTRDFGLAGPDDAVLSNRSIMARALRGYYAGKQQQTAALAPDSPYRRFFRYESSLRTLGDRFAQRLAQVAPQRPPALAGLYTPGSVNALADLNFGRQCANVYDAAIGADILDMRLIAMDYGGWDHHVDEKARFEPRIKDIFGRDQGLATLSRELELLGMLDDLVCVLQTDFGRQLRANGTHGTDHGRGNYKLIWGPAVRGGVYGEMFPASEMVRFDQPGADIEGRTDFRRVLAKACDWMHPGSGLAVFPEARTGQLPIEAGVDLDGLLI